MISAPSLNWRILLALLLLPTASTLARGVMVGAPDKLPTPNPEPGLSQGGCARSDYFQAGNDPTGTCYPSQEECEQKTNSSDGCVDGDSHLDVKTAEYRKWKKEKEEAEKAAALAAEMKKIQEQQALQAAKIKELERQQALAEARERERERREKEALAKQKQNQAKPKAPPPISEPPQCSPLQATLGGC